MIQTPTLAQKSQVKDFLQRTYSRTRSCLTLFKMHPKPHTDLLKSWKVLENHSLSNIIQRFHKGAIFDLLCRGPPNGGFPRSQPREMPKSSLPPGASHEEAVTCLQKAPRLQKNAEIGGVQRLKFMTELPVGGDWNVTGLFFHSVGKNHPN